MDAWGYPYCRGRVMNTVETDEGQYDTVAPVFWATGAALMVRSAVYREAGGLDARFFAHMEEIDFCWRLRSRGYGIVCVPSAVVYHVGGGTLSKENPHKTYLNFRNNLYMLYKNLPDERLSTVMRCRFLVGQVGCPPIFAERGAAVFSGCVSGEGRFHESKRKNFRVCPERKYCPVWS